MFPKIHEKSHAKHKGWSTKGTLTHKEDDTLKNFKLQDAGAEKRRHDDKRGLNKGHKQTNGTGHE